MLRNLDRRVEATCPIYNKTMANELLDIFTIQWNDNCRNRILDKEMQNKYVVKGENEDVIRSQNKIYEYLMNKGRS